jgi:hypothetical protein
VTGCADSIAPDSTGTVSLRGAGTGIASATRAGGTDEVGLADVDGTDDADVEGGDVGVDDLVPDVDGGVVGVDDRELDAGGGDVGEDDLDDASGFDSLHSCFFGMPVETGSLSSSIASSG